MDSASAYIGETDVKSKIAYIEKANEVESFKKEINILSQCNNQYIVHYYGSYIKGHQIWIILEFCDGGSLYELIKILPRNLNEEEIASLTYMILKGLLFLHENKKILSLVAKVSVVCNYSCGSIDCCSTKY